MHYLRLIFFGARIWLNIHEDERQKPENWIPIAQMLDEVHTYKA